MLLFHDTDLTTVNIELQSRTAVDKVIGKRGPIAVNLFFKKGDNIVYRLPTTAEVKLVVKEKDLYDEAPIAQVTPFARPGSDDLPYTALLNTDTTRVRELMFVNGDPSDDEVFIDVMLEINYRLTSDAAWIPSDTVYMRLNNKVSQEGDPDPVGASDPAYVLEAPEDGEIYGRMNGAWEGIGAGVMGPPGPGITDITQIDDHTFRMTYGETSATADMDMSAMVGATGDGITSITQPDSDHMVVHYGSGSELEVDLPIGRPFFDFIYQPDANHINLYFSNLSGDGDHFLVELPAGPGIFSITEPELGIARIFYSEDMSLYTDIHMPAGPTGAAGADGSDGADGRTGAAGGTGAAGVGIDHITDHGDGSYDIVLTDASYYTIQDPVISLIDQPTDTHHFAIHLNTGASWDLTLPPGIDHITDHGDGSFGIFLTDSTETDIYTPVINLIDQPTDNAHFTIHLSTGASWDLALPDLIQITDISNYDADTMQVTMSDASSYLVDLPAGADGAPGASGGGIVIHSSGVNHTALAEGEFSFSAAGGINIADTTYFYFSRFTDDPSNEYEWTYLLFAISPEPFNLVLTDKSDPAKVYIFTTAELFNYGGYIQLFATYQVVSTPTDDQWIDDHDYIISIVPRKHEVPFTLYDILRLGDHDSAEGNISMTEDGVVTVAAGSISFGDDSGTAAYILSDGSANFASGDASITATGNISGTKITATVDGFYGDGANIDLAHNYTVPLLDLGAGIVFASSGTTVGPIGGDYPIVAENGLTGFDNSGFFGFADSGLAFAFGAVTIGTALGTSAYIDSSGLGRFTEVISDYAIIGSADNIHMGVGAASSVATQAWIDGSDGSARFAGLQQLIDSSGFHAGPASGFWVNGIKVVGDQQVITDLGALGGITGGADTVDATVADANFGQIQTCLSSIISALLAHGIAILPP